MKTIHQISSIILFAVFLAGCSQHKDDKKPYVIMLSLDGFRWDYADKAPTPNLDKIVRMGVKAKSLKPSFPSKTFPNHYTMATGLYPDHNGIVLNSFYDPETDREYAIFDRKAVEDGSFYDGEPIWNTAEKQGMKSGTFFWVGSDADIEGMHSSYWKKYEHKFPFEQRIDSVISWLQLPEKVRPHLILWYMHEPDAMGHHFGPDSDEIKEEVIYLDSLVGIFMDKLEALPIANKVNVIVTSDHGMGNISNDRKVIIEESMNMDYVEMIQGYNPNFLVKAKEGFIDSVYLQLKSVPHITCWKTGELPERLHYGTNPRTLDIVVVADSSWSLVSEKKKKVGSGAHGYDNDNKDMHAIFYAYGPAFKSNYTAPTFTNINIYPLIAHILGLEQAKTDGKLENVKGMLK
jgi:alkaline phosphatase D